LAEGPGPVGGLLLVDHFLVTLNFALPRALPGDPIPALADPRSGSKVGVKRHGRA